MLKTDAERKFCWRRLDRPCQTTACMAWEQTYEATFEEVDNVNGRMVKSKKKLKDPEEGYCGALPLDELNVNM